MVRYMIIAATALAALGPLVCAADEPPKLRTFPLGEWYTVTCPQVFRIGTVAEITVAYRGITERTKLCCDLHYQKTDGSYGGFYANDWRPKPDLQGEGKITFAVPIREQEGIASASILLFTDPQAEWATHTRLVTSEPIPVIDPDPGYTTWLKGMKWNKSWIAFDRSTLQRPLTEGDKLEVTLEYYLDPADHYQTTTLQLEALGPRVPKPNAPQPITFENTEHVWYGAQHVEIQPGRGKHTFTLTVPKASPQNNLLLLALFLESRGKRWPWDTRADVWFVRKGGFFELGTEKAGNLFTYDEPVRVLARLRNAKAPGEQKTLRYRVWAANREQVAEGTVSFAVAQEGQAVPIDLKLARRGTFAIRAEVEGWETRETTFCRIPDLLAETRGQPTRFGMTVHAAPGMGARTEEVLQIARRLGLTTCRAFSEWSLIEPGPCVYKLDEWDAFFDLARQQGVDPIICIYNPPAWALPVGQTISYRAFECNLEAWKDMVKTVSERYRGKLWGWEWLNEISPGGPPNGAEYYTNLCRIGTETARSADPKLHFSLAGGLWPRGYRLEVLNAGVGRYIDVLPIHYGNGSGIVEAREDLASFGQGKAAVWENESSSPVITWEWPAQDVVADTVQAGWVLSQWTDELAAGAQKLIYFGGQGDAIGDWDYLYADHSPRPVAATLAVFASKLWDAKPVGTFASLGKAGLVHLFERQGKAIAVASSKEPSGEEVPLAVGAGSVRLTDYQGNETELPAKNGVVNLPLKPLGCFVEGADLDVLKAYLVPTIHVASAGGEREQIGSRPQVTVLRGQPGSIPVRLQNPYSRRLEGKVALDLPTAWVKSPTLPFSLAPGESKVLPVPVTVPESADLTATPHVLAATFASAKLPAVTKPFAVSVISRESVGNLLKNGDFEQAEADGTTPAVWRGTNAQLFPAAGLGLGLGQRVLRFEKATNWEHFGQQPSLRRGTTYLYTAWIWNQGMEGGSNIPQTMQDGSRQDLYNMQVINMGDSTPYWQVFTCRYKAPENLAAVSFVPCARGSGSAMYDNVRVTLFEGTDFAAEAYRVAKPPKIDADLSDWALKCPIPLIGTNQLKVLEPDYQWTPANLNGVAYLVWDNANLYVAVEVMDDAHHAAGDGETVTEGDSVILAFDPSNRDPDAARQASAYYVSAKKPGIGSGVHTLFRPAQHAGGRPAGHLARDSSVYDIAVKPGNGTCVYELRMPWSELGGMAPVFGGKLGFAIQLNDSDGKGLAAQLNWGGGLSPVWSPSRFGVITLVE